jgi:hypothetical protein
MTFWDDAKYAVFTSELQCYLLSFQHLVRLFVFVTDFETAYFKGKNMLFLKKVKD